MFGGVGGGRTRDTGIMSAVLYQLSYHTVATILSKPAKKLYTQSPFSEEARRKKKES